MTVKPLSEEEVKPLNIICQDCGTIRGTTIPVERLKELFAELTKRTEESVHENADPETCFIELQNNIISLFGPLVRK